MAIGTPSKLKSLAMQIVYQITNHRMFKSKRRYFSAQSIIWRRLLEIGKDYSTRHVHGLLVRTGLSAGCKNISRLQINLGINIIQLAPAFSGRPPMLTFVYQQPGSTYSVRFSAYKNNILPLQSFKKIQNCSYFKAR